MLKKAILSMLLFCPAFAWGQLLSVTATLTDSDSVLWKNGTCAVQVVSPNGAPFFGSTPVPTATQTCTINGSGVLSTSIYNTSTITPVNATYHFVICSATTAPCSSFNTAVVAANMTSTLSALLVAPRFSAYTPFAYGYSDVEAIASAPNGQYYNTTTPAFRQWTGSAWSTVGSGGGGCTASGAAGTLQAADGSGLCQATTISQLPNSTVSITTTGTQIGLSLNTTQFNPLQQNSSDTAGSFTLWNATSTAGGGWYAGEAGSAGVAGIPAGAFGWSNQAGGSVQGPWITNTAFDSHNYISILGAASTVNALLIPGIEATPPTASQTVCWLTATSLGHCTSVVGAGGACTCA